MTKDKSGKKDKLKKYDLFSIMMEQSEVFRDMVTRYQSAFGFQTGMADMAADHQPEAAPARTVKRAKASKRTRPAATAKPAATSTKAAKGTATRKAPVAKKSPTRKITKPATKAVASKAARKTPSGKASAKKS